MFQLEQDQQMVSITHNGHVVMGDLQFECFLDESNGVALQLIDQKIEEKVDHLGEYLRYEYLYKANERISFSFILHCYEHIVHAYTDVNIESERLFGRNESLSPEYGVVIKVKKIGDIQGLMANYRHKDWWTRPYFKKELSSLPSRTQSLLWNDKRSYYHLLPICDSVFKSEISGSDDGFDICVSSYDGGRNTCQAFVFALGKSDNPFALSKQITKSVRDVRGESRTIDEKRYPEPLDYLGWCSWDAFYQDVHAEGILDKVKELHKQQVPIKWIMIDDGWSKTHEERLCTFEPDPLKFPNGMQNLTKELKSTYGIQSIGVWHTFAGYWGGIDPASSLASDMAPYLYKTNSQKLIPYPDKVRGYGFWDAWHSYLKQQGIDFVKVDGQSAINNFMMHQMPVGQSSLESHKALEASVGIHFDQCMINCMGMAPENIWNRPISSVSRSSDDFVPDDENGFAEHALQNVYNSFYHGEVYWGDWDMFWTKHKDAERHALLRSVSGGPIYTSDPVNQTNPQILWPLMYKDGRIIRCDQPGKPTADILLQDPTEERVPLKVWNTYGEVGILAAFNIHQDGTKVQGTISSSDIVGSHAEEYFVYDYFNQKFDEMKKDETRDIALEQEESALYFILPKEQSVTPIGLIDKYVSPATFERQYLSENRVVVRVREGGTFAFIAETMPRNVMVNGQKVVCHPLDDNELIYVIDCSDCKQSFLLEINL
jgi:raffinose synthase